MGSYDIDVYRSSHVTFLRCRQDDIMDRTRWGLMGTNFCKNLVLDGCVFSRFDAHMGVTNAHLKNCRLGWQCLNAIGHGTFVVEDTEACGRAVINLREDYGSTWDGEMIIRNCVWYPLDRRACIINGSNSGRHDFGYVCKMPRKLTIERLRIMDDSLARDPEYQGRRCLAIMIPRSARQMMAVRDRTRMRPRKNSTSAVWSRRAKRSCGFEKTLILCQCSGIFFWRHSNLLETEQSFQSHVSL